MLRIILSLTLLHLVNCGEPLFYVITGGKNLVYKVSEKPLSWIDSVKFCQRDGGILAEIHDERSQKAIEFFLESADPSGEHRFWIGLTDLLTEGEFLWFSNRQAITYSNWNKGEPNNVGGTEHFAHINSAERKRTWNDNDNDYEDTFALCQYNLENS